MNMQTFTVKTKSRSDLVDVTNEVADAVRRAGLKHGAVLVFVPHTTAGVTINENADPSVRRDLVAILDRLIPWEAGYEHAEGNSAAHAKSSLVGSSVTVPVENGALALGTWQGVYFCEFDGPRTRQVMVQALAGGK